MDKLDLIIKQIDDLKDDNNKSMDKLEALVAEGFKTMNGRVRRTENDILRIKTLWSAGVVFAGALFHYFFG